MSARGQSWWLFKRRHPKLFTRLTFAAIAMPILIVAYVVGGTIDLSDISRVRSISKVPARTLTRGEMETFSMGGAFLGYLGGKLIDEEDGGMPGAIIGGFAAADGCKVPVMVDGEKKPTIVSAPNEICSSALKPGETVTLERVVETATRGKQTISVTTFYRWPQQ